MNIDDIQSISICILALTNIITLIYIGAASD